MATPTIPNGEEHFFPVVYSGNGQGQRVGKFVPFTDNGTISNSVIFNHSDTTMQLQLPAPASAGNQKTFTFSCWFKRAKLGDQSYLYSVWDGTDHGAPYLEDRHYAQWRTDNTLYINFWGDGVMTNRKFEDTSKWYHYLLAVDSTQSTAADRIKLYIDGDLVTSFSSTSYFAQDSNLAFPKRAFTIGNTKAGDNAQEPFDGYIAEFNAIEGQALLPASFGITDTSTGRWIPKTVEPFPTTTTDIAVTVVSSGGNKYALDGVTQDTVTLIEGATYKFDQSDSSNSGHPLRFSTTSDGTHGGGSEYTTGVTTVGTPGSSGAYTQITVAVGAPTLYYYCTNHSGMGGTANTQDQYGTNGFRLKFQDSSALGDDTSGNGNDFTSTNLTSTDQRTDTPTNNLPTMRPYNPSYNTTQAQGNLQYTPTGTNAGYPMCATLRPNSGKWYAEVRSSSNGGGNVITFGIYIQEDMHYWDNTYNYYPGGQVSNGDGNGVGMQIRNDGNRWLTSSQLNGTVQNNLSGTALAAGDVIGIAVDVDNSLVTWYANDGSSLGSASILRPGSIMFTAMAVTSSDTFNWNFGDNPTFDGTETAGGNTDADGNGNFYHSVPSGFKMLRQDNMAETAKGISGFSWLKSRGVVYNHISFDSSQGVNVRLLPSATNTAVTAQDTLNKFLKGGFQIGSSVTLNAADNPMVAWNWVANSGTTSSNTDGSINSTVQANTTAGFSIVQYTGNATAGATVGHGLSQAPEFIVTKRLDSANSWHGFHSSQGATKYFLLDSTTTFGTSALTWNNTAPNATTFTLGSGNTNNNTGEFVAYCWHPVEGFSKFGQYTGNGNAEGRFVYTGFRPAFLLIKNAQRATNWHIYDTQRGTFNPTDKHLYTTSAAEVTGAEAIDILSNGFKLRSANAGTNRSGEANIYIAFAEHPFVGDGTSPVTAR